MKIELWHHLVAECSLAPKPANAIPVYKRPMVDLSERNWVCLQKHLRSIHISQYCLPCCKFSLFVATRPTFGKFCEYFRLRTQPALLTEPSPPSHGIILEQWFLEISAYMVLDWFNTDWLLAKFVFQLVPYLCNTFIAQRSNWARKSWQKIKRGHIIVFVYGFLWHLTNVRQAS